MDRTCAGEAELERLAQGCEAAGGLREHVSTCAECRRRLEEIRENVEFLRARGAALARAFDAAPADAPGARPAPPDLVPGYELIGEISRGGQGVVYRAVQTSTRRAAAVKMLLGGVFASERQRARFDREIEIAARLRHPGIVTVFESGLTRDGQPYVSMEFVEGTPLDDYIRARHGSPQEGGRQRVEAVMRLMRMIASAAGYAHGSGVIHRDLKPSNIFVDERGTPRILDFGVARAVEAVGAAAMTLEFVGTPAYAAPEQFAGGPARPATDVYALGLIAYQALTGVLPYQVEVPLAQLARTVVSADPPPPSRFVPRLPADVETIVLKCLAKDPARRYSTGDALEADIGDYLAGRPISARRDSTWYVLSMLARRHKAPVAVGVLLLLTILVAALGLGLLARDLDSARREAESALAVSTVQRARLMAAAGDAGRAESLLWGEARRAGMDAQGGTGDTAEARRAAWALTEMYAREPRVFRSDFGARAGRDCRMGFVGFAADGRVWATDRRGRRFWWSAEGTALASSALELAGGEFGWSSRNGRYCIVRDGGLARFLDLDTGLVVSGPAAWPDDDRAISISNDGRLIATLRGDRRVATLTDALSLGTIGEFETDAIAAYLDRRGGRDVLLVSRWQDGTASMIMREAPAWEVSKVIESKAAFGFLRVPVVVGGGAGLIVGLNENVYLFDLERDPPEMVRSAFVRSPVNSISVLEGSGLMAVASADGTLTLLRLSDFGRIGEVSYGSTGQVALSADGRRVAAADEGLRISVYECDPRAWLGKIESSAVTHASIAAARDGAAAWVDDRGDLFIRGAAPPHAITVVHAHQGEATSVDWSPDGSRVLTAGFDGAVREWSRDGAPLRTVTDGLPRVWCARYGPDGRAIAVGDGAGDVRIWKGPRDDPLVFRTGADRVPDLAFSPDGRRLAGASIKRDGIVWDLATGGEVARLTGHHAFMRAIAYSPDGRTIATGDDNRTVRIWDAASGRLIRSIEGLPWGPFELAFHPSGRLLMAVGRGPEVVILDPEAGVELAKLRVLEDDRHLFSLAFEPGGSRLFTAGQSSWIGVMDLERLGSYLRGNWRSGMNQAAR